MPKVKKYLFVVVGVLWVAVFLLSGFKIGLAIFLAGFALNLENKIK